MQLHKGMRVRIKIYEKIPGGWASTMKKYMGEEVTIEKVHEGIPTLFFVHDWTFSIEDIDTMNDLSPLIFN